MILSTTAQSVRKEMIFIVLPADFVIKDSDVLIVMGDEKMLEKMAAS
jgi:K+/H+ antiporter YhaU regulatory subunit KhtT